MDSKIVPKHPGTPDVLGEVIKSHFRKCPKCGSKNIERDGVLAKLFVTNEFKCKDCGHEFKEIKILPDIES